MRLKESLARVHRAVVAAVFCLIACADSVAAQSRIRADVDTAQITVGDHLTMTVTVHHPVGSVVAWPDSLSLAPFEVLDAGRSAPEVSGDSLRTVVQLTLTAFELGDLEVPGFEVSVVGPGAAEETLATDSFAVQVVSVGIDESGDIRDIRGPLTISLSALRVALWLLATLALAGLAWLAWRRLRARRSGEPPARPQRPLRRYVEGRFGVGAPEMTTGEVLERLAWTEADGAFQDGLASMLETCDLVKFAKVRPGADQSRELLALGRLLVEASIPWRPAAERAEAELVGAAPPEPV